MLIAEAKTPETQIANRLAAGKYKASSKGGGTPSSPRGEGGGGDSKGENAAQLKASGKMGIYNLLKIVLFTK